MREGAFYPVDPPSARPETPLVSVLVRTTGRVGFLREALRSVARQTYPAVEVVVVEDGRSTLGEFLRSEFGDLRLRYGATGSRRGRSAAGNLALSMATGEYLTFLDEDDLLYADHIEVLLAALRRDGTRAAYALAIEVPTRIESLDPLRYVEVERHAAVVHRQRFSRAVLWHHNYMPIQSVLFHRSLYDTLGGFDEQLETLEDWNLWTRYALEHPFTFVPKVTSRYRVPAGGVEQRRRSVTMDACREAALARLARMRVTLSPVDVLAYHEELAEVRYLFRLARGDVRRWTSGWLGDRAYAVLRDWTRKLLARRACAS